MAKAKILPAVLRRKVLKFDLGRVVMTVFEPITSQHFDTTLPQNNVVSNAIKRDNWIAIILFVSKLVSGADVEFSRKCFESFTSVK